MNKKHIYTTLLNKDAFLSILWSAIQQGVVALSTYFILHAIEAATEHKMSASIFYLSSFAISLIVVYAPNTLSLVYLQFWRITSTNAFIQSFIDTRYGTTSMAHEREKSKKEAWLTNETLKVYETITNLLYDIFSTSTNALFNILVITFTLDIRILFWYLLAGFILAASHSLFRKRLATAALAVQNNRKNIGISLLAAWENILIGNEYNYSRWRAGYLKNIGDARTATAKHDLVRSFISSGTVSLALIIIAIGNAFFLMKNLDNLTGFASLIITMPRQLQIIQSIFAFFNFSLSWSGVYQQLIELENNLLGSTTENPIKFIQFESITIASGDSKLSVPNFNSLVNQLSKLNSGRITIRGVNGSGKSTLLTSLKEMFANQAFYLPSNYSSMQFNQDFLNQSDGNRLRSIFQEISRIEGIQLLLLDEWDANLDGQNLKKIDHDISELAKRLIIVETRHRI